MIGAGAIKVHFLFRNRSSAHFRSGGFRPDNTSMRRLRPDARWLCFAMRLLILTAAVVVVTAQDVVAQQAGAQDVDVETQSLRANRLVHFFDFEELIDPAKPESKLGKHETLPRFWYMMGLPDASSDLNFLRQPLHKELMTRSGFPRHGIVRFDSAQKTSGDFSLYLGLNAGSSGAFLQVGALPAVAHSDYMITTHVRTTPMEHARARIMVYLIDANGNRIDRSVVASTPFETDGRWETIRLKLYGEFTRAAWIGMQLELLQPTVDVDSPLGAHQIVYQQVEGGAWFDDIAIWQLPQVRVATQSEVNLIRKPDKPALTLLVRDLSGKRVHADVTIYDHQHNVVDRQIQPIGAGLPPQWRWTPELPRFGWYFVDLHVRDSSDPNDFEAPLLARDMTTFLWLDTAMDFSLSASTRFSVVAEGLDDPQMRMLPKLLKRATLPGVVISAWEPTTTLKTVRQRQNLLDEVMNQLTAVNRHTVMSLSPAPYTLIESLSFDPKHPATMFADPANRDMWAPYLRPFAWRYGQTISMWQIGSSVDADAFAAPDWRQLMPKVIDAMGSVTPQSTILAPWPIERDRAQSVSEQAQYALHLPLAVRPESIDDYLASWSDSPPAILRLDIQTPSAEQLPHDARIADLALRMLHAREAGVSELAITRPWTPTVNRQLSLAPDPLLGVFVTVAHQLDDRKVLNRLPLGPGMHAMILHGTGGGVIAAWNESADPDEAEMKMFLGVDPVVTDVWGNRSRPPVVDGKHVVKLTRTPVFIEQVNTQLALFRAAFRIDEPFLESSQKLQHRNLTLYNAWPLTITGQMRISEPNDWRIQPRIKHFSIPAGATIQAPLAIQFPVSETAGDKKLIAQFQFIADREYEVQVEADLEIGLRDIIFDASMALSTEPAPGSRTAVVTQMITNNSSKTASLFVFADLAGRQRKEHAIARLEPGQTVIRRFSFEDVDSDRQEVEVRVGLREANGPAALNMILKPE